MRERAVTIVVVTYNSEAVIGDCLRSLSAAGGSDVGPAIEVVVVDNASSDDTVAVARVARPGTTVLAQPDNRGYAAAINVALAAAPPSDAVLILNPDVRLGAGTLATLRRAAAGRVGVTVPCLVESDGRVCRSIRREPTAGRAWAEALLGGGLAARVGAGEIVTRPSEYERFHQVDWASGAVMLVTVECLDVVGPFDESFFLYSEETDYLLRAQDAGFAVAFVPDAVVVHLGGELSSSAELWSRRTVNRVRLQRRRHGRASTASFLGASLVGEGVRAVAGRATSRRAVKDLCRAGVRILAAPPPPIEPVRMAAAEHVGVGSHGSR